MGRCVVMLAMIIMRNAYVVPNRFLIMIPVVPHKAVAEVSKIGNL